MKNFFSPVSLFIKKKKKRWKLNTERKQFGVKKTSKNNGNQRCEKYEKRYTEFIGQNAAKKKGIFPLPPEFHF